MMETMVLNMYVYVYIYMYVCICICISRYVHAQTIVYLSMGCMFPECGSKEHQA